MPDDDIETTDYDSIERDNARPDRRTLVIALGAVGLLALSLAIIRATRARPGATTLDEAMDSGDLRASLEHLAGAFEIRVRGIEERLDAMVSDTVAHAATVSTPPVVLVEPTPDERIPPTVGAEEPPPPGPASVSV